MSASTRSPTAPRRHAVDPQPFPGEPPGAQRQRQRDVGLLVDAGRDLQRSAADVEDQQPAGGPAEPAPHGEERHDRLGFAGEDLEVDAGLVADPAQHRRRVRASRTAEVANASRSSVSWFAAASRALAAASTARRRRCGELAVGADLLGEAEFGLLRVCRPRVRAVMRVDHEQVDRIGTHIEHAESHAPTVKRCRRSAYAKPMEIMVAVDDPDDPRSREVDAGLSP